MNAFANFEYLMFTTISEGAREVAALFWSCRRYPPPLPDDEEIDGLIDVVPDVDNDAWKCPAESFHIDQVAFDLHWGYVNRPERRWFPAQLFFWEPRSTPGHCVMMGNSTDGYQHASYLPSVVTSWQYTFTLMQEAPEQHPNYMFDYYRDYRRTAREIGAGYFNEDRKWLFCQDGPIQPFENPEYYTRRRIKDRFNREVITEYLSKLGYDITHDDFWTTDKPAWVVWTDFKGTIKGPSKRSPGIWSAND